ncbi:hypothetical protein [Sorangium sp. So ce381]|uniref:hypothetical protein n=1 Tax=Sorangium sp. So ce381 TaxID=3133307 RepID=UPI003F5B6AD5
MNAADHGAAVFTDRTRDAMITDTPLRAPPPPWPGVPRPPSPAQSVAQPASRPR